MALSPCRPNWTQNSLFSSRSIDSAFNCSAILISVVFICPVTSDRWMLGVVSPDSQKRNLQNIRFWTYLNWLCSEVFPNVSLYFFFFNLYICVFVSFKMVQIKSDAPNVLVWTFFHMLKKCYHSPYIIIFSYRHILLTVCLINCKTPHRHMKKKRI